MVTTSPLPTPGAQVGTGGSSAGPDHADVPSMPAAAAAPAAAAPAAAPHARLARRAATLRGTDAAWVRPAWLGVTFVAAVLYLANLTVSGFANTYYSAAALAASQSWTAWFFGSFDAAGFITVDKPPLATMLMGLSVRVLGLSSWSVLLPEALCGIATVAVLFAIVKRSFGPVAATIAGLVMAVTPVSVLIFRYNNPDALLTLLLVLAAGAFLRGLEDGRIRWAVAAAILVGLAFNVKLLQAYLVLPAFAVVWAVAAPGSTRRRVAGLVASVVAVVLASGWWVAAVELVPAAVRPYVGGSTTDSALDLVLGYDGLARVFGMSAGGGGMGGGGFSGTPGILRLFNAELGGQVAWLLPFALVALVAGVALRGRAPRTDLRRAAYLMWGGWLLVTAAVFSFMSGVIHSYYAVALVPAIAALVGGGAVDMWALRQRSRWGGIPLAGGILASAATAWVLLERSPSLVPGLGVAVLIAGAVAAVVVALPVDAAPRLRLAVAAIGVAALLAGPVAYSTYTVGQAISGGDPSAGPQVASGGGRAGPGSAPAGLAGVAPLGAPPMDGAAADGSMDGAGAMGAPGPMGAPGAQGGQGAFSDTALVEYLLASRGTEAWIVAVTSANTAAPIQLATGAPVMAMGGFSGSDPAPTLAELQGYIASGELRFVIVGAWAGPGARGGPGVSTSSERDTWVTTACERVDYGGAGSSALYDCAGAVTAGG
ncbi:MAG: glycosyltransferase family 39 protein [Chloroflexi bacterium]|nr:glycosyltransferase family 39 protein [Chloroflexota bacterium]